MDQKLVLESVITEQSSTVNSFENVSLIIVLCGENAFCSAGEFLYCNTTSGHWEKLEARLSGAVVSRSIIH